MYKLHLLVIYILQEGTFKACFSYLLLSTNHYITPKLGIWYDDNHVSAMLYVIRDSGTARGVWYMLPDGWSFSRTPQGQEPGSPEASSWDAGQLMKNSLLEYPHVDSPQHSGWISRATIEKKRKRPYCVCPSSLRRDSTPSTTLYCLKQLQAGGGYSAQISREGRQHSAVRACGLGYISMWPHVENTVYKSLAVHLLLVHT